MPLKLYNTLTKREEEFAPRKKGHVTMYTCGPTVYGRPHIGNYSSFLMADLLRRWLEASGHKVKHVKNITDVGHLIADRDDGEDKIEKQAREEKLEAEKGQDEGPQRRMLASAKPEGEAGLPAHSPKASKQQTDPDTPSKERDTALTKADVLRIVEKYTNQYLDDEKALNILEPFARPRATEYIEPMIKIIESLVAKKHAYETEDGVYFAVETFRDYGKLSGNTLEKLHAGARIALDEAKKHPSDFALWKKCVGENAKHVLRWHSPWGEGFPGWHIECSAMSASLLGEQIDLHTGGEDNIFPHHECEIAQSECAFQKAPFVRMWLHKRRIDLQGEKMSKSLGNVLTIPDISAKGYSPLDLRYYFLSVHYRTNLKFSEKGIESARKVRLKVLEWIEAVEKEAVSAVPNPNGEANQTIENAADSFKSAMDSDLNTPEALAAVFSLMNADYSRRTQRLPLYKTDARRLLEFIEIVKRVMGCFEAEDDAVPPKVSDLLDERRRARDEKNFKESDRLRREIGKLGYEVRDGEDGQVVRRV